MELQKSVVDVLFCTFIEGNLWFLNFNAWEIVSYRAVRLRRDNDSDWFFLSFFLLSSFPHLFFHMHHQTLLLHLLFFDFFILPFCFDYLFLFLLLFHPFILFHWIHCKIFITPRLPIPPPIFPIFQKLIIHNLTPSSKNILNLI